MYKHRIKIFLGLIVVVFLAVIARLGYLQVIRGDELRLKAEELTQYSELLPAPRGQILDRNGRILAMDQPCYDFCMDYRFLVSDPETASHLAGGNRNIGPLRWVRQQQRRIAKEKGLSRSHGAEVERLYAQRTADTWLLAEDVAAAADCDLQEAVDRIVRRVEAIHDSAVRRNDNLEMEVQEQRVSHAVVPGLDEQKAAEYRSRLEDTVGASILPSTRRWYPCGDIACHILGVTGQVDPEEVRRDEEAHRAEGEAGDDRDRYFYGDIVGKSGMEKACEEQLRGRRGYRLLKRGEVLREEPVEPGRDVRLSLDIELQKELTEKMADTPQYFPGLPPKITAAAVVISVPTGEVLAMVSIPTYDLNGYRRNYSELAKDAVDLPLMNRAVAGLYPPGSTAKPVTAMAGLATGEITAGTVFDCRGYLWKPEDKLTCDNHNGHGPLDLIAGMQKSCNVYFFNVGLRVGPERLSDWFGKAGFTERPGTGLPEERAGIVRNPEWYRAHEHREWPRAETANMAIGQGFVAVSPLHVANAMATIARKGRFLSPILTRDGGPKQVDRVLPISGEQLEAIRRGLFQVVNERGGTAFSVFHGPGVEPLGVVVCGKTGTAQTEPQKIDTNGDHRPDEIVKSGDTGWFAGFAPYTDPQIAFAVMVEYVPPEMHGARSAGPIAVELVRLCKKYGYVK